MRCMHHDAFHNGTCGWSHHLQRIRIVDGEVLNVSDDVPAIGLLEAESVANFKERRRERVHAKPHAASSGNPSAGEAEEVVVWEISREVGNRKGSTEILLSHLFPCPHPL